MRDKRFHILPGDYLIYLDDQTTAQIQELVLRMDDLREMLECWTAMTESLQEAGMPAEQMVNIIAAANVGRIVIESVAKDMIREHSDDETD